MSALHVVIYSHQRWWKNELIVRLLMYCPALIIWCASLQQGSLSFLPKLVSSLVYTYSFMEHNIYPPCSQKREIKKIQVINDSREKKKNFSSSSLLLIVGYSKFHFWDPNIKEGADPAIMKKTSQSDFGEILLLEWAAAVMFLSREEFLSFIILCCLSGSPYFLINKITSSWWRWTYSTRNVTWSPLKK